MDNNRATSLPRLIALNKINKMEKDLLHSDPQVLVIYLFFVFGLEKIIIVKVKISQN